MADHNFPIQTCQSWCIPPNFWTHIPHSTCATTPDADAPPLLPPPHLHSRSCQSSAQEVPIIQNHQKSDGKFSGWRKSDQLWPAHWGSVELSQVSTLLQLGNRPHPPGGQKPWRDLSRPRGRKHKHCYCCSISDAILGWKILDYSDYSYTFWSSIWPAGKKNIILRASPLRFVATSEVETKHNKRHAAEGFLHIWVCLKIGYTISIPSIHSGHLPIFSHVFRSENGHFTAPTGGSSSSMVAKSSPHFGLDEWLVNWPCLGMVELCWVYTIH